jgi:hypothetical protein
VVKQVVLMQRLITKSIRSVKQKVDEEFPMRVITRELDDLNEIIESSYGLITEQLKQKQSTAGEQRR